MIEIIPTATDWRLKITLIFHPKVSVLWPKPKGGSVSPRLTGGDQTEGIYQIKYTFHLTDGIHAGRMGSGCLSQSSTESGSWVPLVSGSIRHSPEPMIGPLLYTTKAATEITPLGCVKKREFAREPKRKLRLTREKQRCLDQKKEVNRMWCQQAKCLVC